jgi:hypothetical protein
MMFSLNHDSSTEAGKIKFYQGDELPANQLP